MNFLRNNPKLMLQMIPHEDSDDQDNVTLVGKPRPAKKKSSRPPKPVKVISSDDQSRLSAKPRFLAMSEDHRSGPAIRIKGKFQSQKHPVTSTRGNRDSNALAQKPIKLRGNVLRDKAFYERKFSQG